MISLADRAKLREMIEEDAAKERYRPRVETEDAYWKRFDRRRREREDLCDRLIALLGKPAWPTNEDEADRLLFHALMARVTYGDGTDAGTPEEVDDAVDKLTEPDKWWAYKAMTQRAVEAFTTRDKPAGVAGWKLVPCEPTEAMIEAALESHAVNEPFESPFGPNGSFATNYRAM